MVAGDETTMPTSRPIQRGEWLTDIRSGSPFLGASDRASGLENPDGCVLQSDFELEHLEGDEYWHTMCERVFGISVDNPISMETALTNGAAPGLYVCEGDDTSNWEVYREVLARRVEEAMAARRDGEGGVGADETTTAIGAQTTSPTVSTRRDDEIRVGDVVEVVSCSDAFTAVADVGGGGRVVSIEHENAPTRAVYLTPCDGLRVPRAGFVSLADVRKVTSPSPQTVAAVASPMPEGEASRIEAAVSDEVRRRISSPLASGSETTRRHVVNPVPPAVSVSLRPRDFTAAAITDYLQSLGATQVYVRQAPGNPPVVEVAGLSRQAFDTACQNLPVGIQLRVVGSFLGERDSGETTEARIIRSAQSEPPTPPPPPPSRFSLLEIDADVKDTAPLSPLQALKAAVDLAALQAELRAEREAKRALTAAQTPPGRFDLLECDLPAVPAAAAVKPAKAPPQRPGVSSPPPKPRPKTHNPVETITDLTTARSPLELARMLEGLNDELSTMMRQREVN